MAADHDPRVRRAAGAVAAAALAVVMLPPLAPATDHTLSAHMAQHLLLLFVIGPAAALWSRSLGAVTPRARARHWWVAITLAVAVDVTVMLGWHAPALFDAAGRSEPVHALEHLSMIGASFWLWRVLLRDPAHRGFAVLALFVTTIPMTVLGLGLLLSTTPWYSGYTDVVDQQVAGALMWAVGGAIVVAQGVALFVAWLARGDQVRAGTWVSSRSARPTGV